MSLPENIFGNRPDEAIEAGEITYSEHFYTQLDQVWGNPKKMATVALNEAFNAGAELDYDDQMEAALELGVLAGMVTALGLSKEDFISAATNEVLAGLLPDQQHRF